MTIKHTRGSLFRRAEEMAKRINELFEDADHWNRIHPDQPIDPDPKGELKNLLEGLEKSIIKEKEIQRTKGGDLI